MFLVINRVENPNKYNHQGVKVKTISEAKKLSDKFESEERGSIYLIYKKGPCFDGVNWDWVKA